MTQQTRPSPSARPAPGPRPRMSYQDFLRSEPDGEPSHAEWVDGEVVMIAPVSDEHDDVAGFLYAALRSYVEHHRLGVVKHDPYQMKTGPKLPGRAPDILF